MRSRVREETVTNKAGAEEEERTQSSEPVLTDEVNVEARRVAGKVAGGRKSAVEAGRDN
jgi:hypothetical protein